MKITINYIVKQTRKAMLLFLFMAILASCSDNPTSNSSDEAPFIPDFSVMEMDVSYFTERPPYKIAVQNSEHGEAYFMAYTYAVNAANLFNAYGSIGFLYLGLAELGVPKYDNSEWNWVYSYQMEGVFTEMKLTSKPVSNGLEWNLFITIDIAGEESINNAKLMSGFSSNDGKTGSWSLFLALEDSANNNPVLKFEWNKQSETNLKTGFKIFSENSSSQIPVFEIDYESNGTEYLINYTDREDASVKVIYWNVNTETGYIIEDGVKSCWNQSLETTAC